MKSIKFLVLACLAARAVCGTHTLMLIPHRYGANYNFNRDHYEQPGIGIGLSIVRDSARIHGGDCVIESEKGKGTLVTLNLPLSR